MARLTILNLVIIIVLIVSIVNGAPSAPKNDPSKELAGISQREFSLLVMNKSTQAWKGQQLTFSQVAKMATALDKMINSTRMIIGDIFGLKPSAISPTSEGIRTFLRANAGSLTPAQVDILREAMENSRDNYALDLIKLFGWDEKDIDLDRTTFCTYAKCKAQSQSTTSKPTTTTIKPRVNLLGKIKEKLYEIINIVEQLEDQNEFEVKST